MNYELFKHSKKSIFLVNMTKDLGPAMLGINHHFSELALKGLEKYTKTGGNIAIIVNKK
jgi:hypothetical protein